MNVVSIRLDIAKSVVKTHGVNPHGKPDVRLGDERLFRADDSK